MKIEKICATIEAANGNVVTNAFVEYLQDGKWLFGASKTFIFGSNEENMKRASEWCAVETLALITGKENDDT